MIKENLCAVVNLYMTKLTLDNDCGIMLTREHIFKKLSNACFLLFQIKMQR